MPKKLTELEQALSQYTKIKKRKICVEDVRELQKNFKTTIDNAKRETQELERKTTSVRPSRTRSGLRRGGAMKLDEHTQGKFVNKGMDDVADKFDDDEVEYLDKDILKVKHVKDLKFEHLKYLVSYKLLDDLKKIKEGKLKSSFHDRYVELKGRCKNELLSEIRMSLFKSEQRDYINGFLQELFGATKKDENGDIKHSEINYVETVMLFETSLRIVQFVHQFPSIEETMEFMKSKSRQAYGISDDED